MISKSIKFPYTTQLKYCPKLDFEVDPKQQMKNPNKENMIKYVVVFFRFQNQLHFLIQRNFNITKNEGNLIEKHQW